MRNFVGIALLVCSGLFAQDSVGTGFNEKEPVVAPVKFTVDDIQRDTSGTKTAAFEENFKQKYRSPEFDYEPKPLEKTILDRFLEWLGRLLRNMFNLGGGQAISAATWIFRILCVAIVLFVVYLIVKAILNKDGQWVFGRNSASRIYSADEIEKNLQQADFEKLVSQTLSNGDKRLAIRYYYLWLLQRLSKAGIIAWDLEKTNSDYLYEIQNEKQREDFAYLSYLYNYVWYGEFETDDDTFLKARRAFEKTIKST